MEDTFVFSESKCVFFLWVSLLILINKEYASYFRRETAYENKQFKRTKTLNLIHTWSDKQGRIQNLSEGGARLISEQKNPDLGTKRLAEGDHFFKIDIFFCFALGFSFA